MKSLYIINMKGNSLLKAVEGGSIEIFDEGVKYKTINWDLLMKYLFQWMK